MHYVDEFIDGEGRFSLALYPSAVAHLNCTMHINEVVDFTAALGIGPRNSCSPVTGSHFVEHFWKRFVSLILTWKCVLPFLFHGFYFIKMRETNRRSQPRQTKGNLHRDLSYSAGSFLHQIFQVFVVRSTLFLRIRHLDQFAYICLIHFCIIELLRDRITISQCFFNLNSSR